MYIFMLEVAVFYMQKNNKKVHVYTRTAFDAHVHTKMPDTPKACTRTPPATAFWDKAN